MTGISLGRRHDAAGGAVRLVTECLLALAAAVLDVLAATNIGAAEAVAAATLVRPEVAALPAALGAAESAVV